MSACRSCKADLKWARTHASGTRIPLDAEPVDPGTPAAFVVTGGVAYPPDAAADQVAERRGISTAAAREVLAADFPWHVSHFSTCPDADKHRRSR